MPWFYYNGNTVRSIRVSDSISVAVRPHSKVEVQKITKEVQGLINSGVLQRTGKGKDAIRSEKAAEKAVKLQDVLQRSELAMSVAEKGITASANLPPKKAVGNQEMTIGELHIASLESEKAKKVTLAVDVVIEPRDTQSRDHVRVEQVVGQAEVLSSDDGEEVNKKRRKKRDSSES